MQTLSMQEALDLVKAERMHQDALFGELKHYAYTPNTWLALIKLHVAKAEAKVHFDDSPSEMFREIAGLAVAAMEQHGGFERIDDATYLHNN